MKELAQKIVDRVVGTPEDILVVVQDMIVEKVISQDEWDLNEIKILGLVDDEMFMCETCSWNVFTWEMSDEPYVCTDCYQGE